MSGFEPRISGVGSDRSANCATTTAQREDDDEGIQLHAGFEHRSLGYIIRCSAPLRQLKQSLKLFTPVSQAFQDCLQQQQHRHQPQQLNPSIRIWPPPKWHTWNSFFSTMTSSTKVGIDINVDNGVGVDVDSDNEIKAFRLYPSYKIVLRNCTRRTKKWKMCLYCSDK